MRLTAFPLLVAIAFITISFNFVTAEQIQDHPSTYADNTRRRLEIDQKATDDLLPAEDEERGVPMLNRMKSLLRRRPNKSKDAKLDKSGAMEALTKLKSIVGLSKKPTEITPAKAKALETYAHDNPSKWEAMAYYLDNVYALSLMFFLAGGSLFLGWRYIGT